MAFDAPTPDQIRAERIRLYERAMIEAESAERARALEQQKLRRARELRSVELMEEIQPRFLTAAANLVLLDRATITMDRKWFRDLDSISPRDPSVKEFWDAFRQTLPRGYGMTVVDPYNRKSPPRVEIFLVENTPDPELDISSRVAFALVGFGSLAALIAIMFMAGC